MIRPIPSPSLPLSAEEAVVSILAATRQHEVHGKKRLHKTIFLCTFCDAPIRARFSIRHFGVFSLEIAGALDLLTTFGDLKMREEQIGPNGYFATVYVLPEKPKYKVNPIIVKVVDMLEKYSTPSLEVASTVAYFLKQGLPEQDAMRETKRIKPDLSTSAQFTVTKALLKGLAGLRASTDGQRPKNS